MTVDELARFLEQPDVHRALLGDYTGPFALGVGGTEEAPVIALGIQQPSRVRIRRMRVGDEWVPVVVTRIGRPRALPGYKRLAANEG
ncbi:MAG: hypothetical protein H6704_05580 [Myxococcales bacterium]|nr:hypothetical protein [Myxococcales bacterium]